MPAPERMAFAEFTRRQEMSPRLARAFEMDLRQRGQTFSYRTQAEWEQELALFHAADRRRRS